MHERYEDQDPSATTNAECLKTATAGEKILVKTLIFDYQATNGINNLSAIGLYIQKYNFSTIRLYRQEGRIEGSQMKFPVPIMMRNVSTFLQK